jgi:hypothetical protein
MLVLISERRMIMAINHLYDRPLVKLIPNKVGICIIHLWNGAIIQVFFYLRATPNICMIMSIGQASKAIVYLRDNVLFFFFFFFFKMECYCNIGTWSIDWGWPFKLLLKETLFQTSWLKSVVGTPFFQF